MEEDGRVDQVEQDIAGDFAEVYGLSKSRSRFAYTFQRPFSRKPVSGGLYSPGPACYRILR